MAPPRDPFKVELPPGTTHLLFLPPPAPLALPLLQTLSLGPMHGYGIAQHIGRMSAEALRVEEGSLYPALQRLRLRGWVKAQWRLTPTRRRARYYELTRAGRKHLAAQGSAVD